MAHLALPNKAKKHGPGGRSSVGRRSRGLAAKAARSAPLAGPIERGALPCR